MNWVKKYTYDPWGKLLSEESASGYDSLKCPFTYAGYFHDSETGLYYMPARYYSPTLKRFLTRDPAAGSKSNPQTLNPYQYCCNDPINSADPSGQWSIRSRGVGKIGVDTSGLEKMVNDLKAWRENMDFGDCGLSKIQAFGRACSEFGRAAARFANGMSNFRNSIHIGRGPSFDFSGIAEYRRDQFVRSVLRNIHIDSGSGGSLSFFSSSSSGKGGWSFGFQINLVVVNFGWDSRSGPHFSGGLSTPGVSASLSYDPNSNNNAGGTTVGASGYYYVGGGVIYEPGTGDVGWSIGVGTPGVGVEGDRVGD